MKLYIIAGEASGDLHGSNLIKSLLKQDPTTQVRAWGGDLMQAQGADLIKHYRELAFMGFVEVLLNLKTILRNLQSCKDDILAWQPDALVLIDYPGFNMRIAKWAKAQGIRVVYYISPQIWAWNERRVYKIKDTVDKMLCILPFEPDFYRKYDYAVEYVGHPLLDVIAENAPAHSPLQGKWQKPVIALLPGSRKQEVAKMLAIMLAVAPKFEQYQFVIAGAPSLDAEFYAAFRQTSTAANIDFISNQTYALLQIASAALVTSGTATLEVALHKVPEIVCYKGNIISFWIARQLIKVKYISLVNLIMDKPVVLELIQSDFNAVRLAQELETLLTEPRRAALRADYDTLWQKLGGKGASDRAAAIILDLA